MPAAARPRPARLAALHAVRRERRQHRLVHIPRRRAEHTTAQPPAPATTPEDQLHPCRAPRAPVRLCNGPTAHPTRALTDPPRHGRRGASRLAPSPAAHLPQR
jgi:hypothetical protein